jgi:oligopeptide transport system substrate-binding protein
MAPRAKTHEERLAIFTQAEKMLMDDLPVLPIYIYTSKQSGAPLGEKLSLTIF